MEYYAETEGGIHPNDMRDFEHICRQLKMLPNMKMPGANQAYGRCENQVRCHELCVALGKYNPSAVIPVHGYFMNHYQHSWLITNRKTAIIDPYPVGGASPFIVVNNIFAPWDRLYKEEDINNLIKWRVDWQRIVDDALYLVIQKISVGNHNLAT